MPLFMQPFTFRTPAIEGIIEKRKSQFTMLVNHNGTTYNCHCPTTGRIGNLDLAGRPCLLSFSENSVRKTAFTVEAVSLNNPKDMNKNWIGINQNAVNRYVEYFLVNGGFSDMIETIIETKIGAKNSVYREQKLGQSKLDFLVGNTFIEVKMPLQHLQINIPDYVKTKKITPFSYTDRMTRHITELGNSLKTNQRAIMLICFMYDNPGFKVIERSTNYENVKRIVDENIAKGVEIWQANFKIDPTGVRLSKYWKIEIK